MLFIGTKMFLMLLPDVFCCFPSPECSKLCLEGGQMKAQFAGCFMETQTSLRRQILSGVALWVLDDSPPPPKAQPKTRDLTSPS